MSKKGKIAIIAGFTVLILLVGVLFAKIGQLESEKTVSASVQQEEVSAKSNVQSETVTQSITEIAAEPMETDGLLSMEATIGDSWGSYGAFSCNTSLKLYNNSEYTATDWSITIPVQEGTKIDNIWSGVQTNENNVITITPADYNKEIPPHQAADIGFIITSVSQLSLDNYSAKALINGSMATFTYTKPEEVPVEDTAAPLPETVGDNGVSVHGQLKVVGTQLSDKDGNPVVLKGMSSHGLAWYPQFTNEYTLKKTKEYGANVYRAAMYTEEYGGYTTGADFQSTAKELAYKAVDTAIQLDMYAILDWHILADGSPSKHKAEAISFFDEASKKYANNPAVIYEICNEPNGSNWSGDIKPYANEVIPVIRKNSPNAVILVGTNTWSQDVDEASKDKLDFDNVMYTFHFYAGTHNLDAFKGKIETALANGCGVFVSEWGTTKADGSQGIYLDESNKWLEYLKSKNISRVNWSLADKNESSAAFKPGTNCENFGYDDLTESGKFVFDSFVKY